MKRTIIAIILALIFGTLIGWGLDTYYIKVLHETTAMISAGEEIENITFTQWFIAGRMIASFGNPYNEPGQMASKAILFAAILAALLAMIGEKYGRGKAAVIIVVIILLELYTYGFNIFGFGALESNVAWVGGAFGGLATIFVLTSWTILRR